MRASLGFGSQKREVLHGLSLRVATGRWTSIVGPNGAGKSTLLQCLAGLLPCSGTVRWGGQDLRQLAQRQRARRLAWLGQNETSAMDLRVWDVVMLGRLPHQGWLSAPSAADAAAVQAALQATQAWDWRERSLGQLSGGERQRVLLARALAVQAPMLLLDEPLANLDPPHQADWLALVRTLVAQGVTVLSVLHELGAALHADDMLIVQDGRVLHHGACQEVGTHRALESVFAQRVAVRRMDNQWVALPVVAPAPQPEETLHAAP